MSDVLQRHTNNFFDSLVGSPLATAEFELRLTQYVRQGSPNTPSNSFTRLRTGLSQIVADFSDKKAAEDPDNEDTLENFALNAEAGSFFTVLALESLHSLYMLQASGPQYVSSVRRNVNTVLDYIIKLSKKDETSFMLNLQAASRGEDPQDRDRRQQYLHWVGLYGPDIDNLQEAFETKDRDGQLEIRLKDAPLSRLREGTCRGARAMTYVEGSGHRLSLRVYSDVIARVAIKQIFSQNIEIIDDTPQGCPAHVR